MYASTVAWLFARARTVRLAVFVPVEGMSPLNEASVAPFTFAIDFMTFTASAPAATLVPVDVVWFTDVAKTSTAPAGAENDAFARTFASVSALVLISASPHMTAADSAPIEIARIWMRASLPLVAWTLMPALPEVTLPSTDEVVPPLTRAVGTETAMPARPPPAATSVRTNASLSDSAANSTWPDEVICWSLFASDDVASTSADEPTSANWSEMPMPATPDADTASVRASARFAPFAFTSTEDELVTLPSSFARTAPLTSAREAKTPAATKAPPLMLSTSAIASLRWTTSGAFPPRMRCAKTSEPRKVCALFRSARTWTAPLEATEPDAPIEACVYAPLVTSASAYAPEMPTSETPPIVTCAFARYSDSACTVTLVEPVIVPFSAAEVWPETRAIGSMTFTETPPTVAAGAHAYAVFVASAVTVTAPVVLVEPPVISASVLRSSLAIATVTPIARPPAVMFSVFAFTPPCTPVAVTSYPSTPSGPCAPEAARVVPL